MEDTLKFGCGDPNCLDCGPSIDPALQETECNIERGILHIDVGQLTQSEIENHIESNRTKFGHTEIQGILILHLNVGKLAQPEIENFMESMRIKFRTLFHKLRCQGWENMIFPCRNQPSRVEVVRLK